MTKIIVLSATSQQLGHWGREYSYITLKPRYACSEIERWDVVGTKEESDYEYALRISEEIKIKECLANLKEEEERELYEQLKKKFDPTAE